MSAEMIIVTIVGMFAVTFPVRFIPLVYFNRIDIPRAVKIWLGYVPLALFAAFLTQIILGDSVESFELTEKIPLLISCTFTLLVTLKTRSIGFGMALGFLSYIGLTYIFFA